MSRDRRMIQTLTLGCRPRAGGQAKKEMMSATRKPTPPTSVSMMVQVLRVVFSSMPTRLFTSQKPESLKWEQTVEPQRRQPPWS